MKLSYSGQFTEKIKRKNLPAKEQGSSITVVDIGKPFQKLGEMTLLNLHFSKQSN